MLTLTLGDEVLGYTDEGDGPVTLLAIPGLPGTVRDFRWLAPALTDAVRLVRVELPGYGHSTRRLERGMDVAERAAVVIDLIERLKLGSVVTLGHSAGCLVSAHIARHRPELVERAIFLASPGLRPHYPLCQYQLFASVLRRPRLARPLAPVLRRLYRAAGFPSYLSDDERRFTTLDAAVQDFDAHAANVRAMSCPTLVCWAADDRLIPDDFSAALAKAIPDSTRLRFEEGGHNIQKTRAFRVADEILHELGLAEPTA